MLEANKATADEGGVDQVNAMIEEWMAFCGSADETGSIPIRTEGEESIFVQYWLEAAVQKLSWEA